MADVTLWALAVVVGIGIIAGGVAEALFAFRYRRELPRWGLWWLDGLVSIAVGVLALVWPEATVVVIAVLFGIRLFLAAGRRCRSAGACATQLETAPPSRIAPRRLMGRTSTHVPIPLLEATCHFVSHAAERGPTACQFTWRS